MRIIQTEKSHQVAQFFYQLAHLGDTITQFVHRVKVPFVKNKRNVFFKLLENNVPFHRAAWLVAVYLRDQAAQLATGYAGRTAKVAATVHTLKPELREWATVLTSW